MLGLGLPNSNAITSWVEAMQSQQVQASRCLSNKIIDHSDPQLIALAVSHKYPPRMHSLSIHDLETPKMRRLPLSVRLLSLRLNQLPFAITLNPVALTLPYNSRLTSLRNTYQSTPALYGTEERVLIAAPIPVQSVILGRAGNLARCDGLSHLDVIWRGLGDGQVDGGRCCCFANQGVDALEGEDFAEIVRVRLVESVFSGQVL